MHDAYVPLHQRIQHSKEANKEVIADLEAKEKEMCEMYATLFSTEVGVRVLDHMVNTYLARYPKEDATPNAVMYGYGQEHVVKDILRRIEK